MDKKQAREFNETINHIFKMNEKEVISNEVKSLIEDIDKNQLQGSKVLILINFIQYKLNELDNHQELAKEMLKHSKEINSNVLHIFSQYCDDHNFHSVKKFIVDLLIEKLLEIKNITIDHVKYSFKKISQKSLQNKELQQREGNVIKYIESKFEERKTSSKEIFENLTPEEIMANPNTFAHVACNNISFANEFAYDLRIYYLGGADSCSQNCSIKSSTPLDLHSFIFYLKKKLGIYEHAKFKIVILNKEKEETDFLQNISQLSLKDTNELKIVPDDHLIAK